MIRFHRPSLLPYCLAALLLVLGALPLAAQSNSEKPEQIDMAEMMKQARKFTEPGKGHKFLHRFIGEWDSTIRITAPGMNNDPTKGRSTFRWLIDGRWIQSEIQGTVLGMPFTSFGVMGYDNFKQSYRVMTVSNFDTAMLTSEGDLDPNGEVLITYGTLDEYLTGEHDKMVKNVWRFLSKDEFIVEIHDLPIGEKNTQVIEMTFKRVKPTKG